MFDPTIFENLKVVIEGGIYDLDLDGSILVTGRNDLVDLADMSRTFAMRFRLKDGNCEAELRLAAGLRDLAGEKLEWKHATLGCTLQLNFTLTLKDAEESCAAIQKQLESLWGGRPEIVQTLSYPFGEERSLYRNDISCRFNRKIDEGHWSDLPELLNVMVVTLETLEPFDEGVKEWSS